MTLMRCLWLTRQEPFAANSGELIYSSGLLRALAESGASIRLLGYDGNQLNSSGELTKLNIDISTVGPIPSRRITNFFSSLPSDADRLRGEQLQKELDKHLRAMDFDAFIVDHAALGWAVDSLKTSKSKRKPLVVYVSHNCEAIIRQQIAENCRGNVIKRLVMQRDAKKYARLEQRLCRAANLITAITPEDCENYQQWFPDKSVITLMPGYQEQGAAPAAQPIGPNTPRRVLMVGSFEWIAKRHNLEALLAAADPVFHPAGIELQIVGKAQPEYARAIQSRFACATFHANVPEVEPFLREARMGLIAETVGGGFKLKTLEYAFNKLPIAALENALGGVELTADQDAIVEQTLPDLVKSIVERIDDFEFLNRAASRTAEQFASRFSWIDRGQAFYQAISDLMPASDSEHAAPSAIRAKPTEAIK